MIRGAYFNIQRYCLHDGDGIRTTVFLKGCPLRCLWCHNPESQNAGTELFFHSGKCVSCGRCVPGCQARTLEHGKLIFDREKCTLCGNCEKACFYRANELCGKTAAPDEILNIVAKDKIFYDTSGGGMTLSGGEPAMQSEFSLALIRGANKMGIHTAIETCGYGEKSFFLQAAKEGCTFLYDIKAIDPKLHKALIGVTNERIFDNLSALFACNADIIIRLPLVPTVNDSDDALKALAAYLAKYRHSFRYAEIMAYHKLGTCKETDLGRVPALNVPEGERYENTWQEKLQRFGIDVMRSDN